MKALVLFLGILLLVAGIFAAVAPQGVLDMLGLSHQEGQWSIHEGIIPYPQYSYETIYDIDPNIVRAGGAALGTIGLVLVAWEIALEKRGI